MNARRVLTLLFLLAFAALLFVRWRGPSDAASPGAGATPMFNDALLAVSRLDTDKGIAQFETRVKEDPRDFLSYTILGQLYNRRGRDRGSLADFERAEQAFQQALRLNPEHTAARSALAAAFASQHKFAAALTEAQTVRDKTPNSIDALATLTDAYLETGQYKEGEETLELLTSKLGEDPAVLARRAQMAELKGQTGPAVTLMQRAVDTMRREADPGPEVAWYEARLGDIFFHTGCLAESERHFDAALRLYDTYPLGLAGLADIRNVQGRFEDAKALYERAVAGAPQPRRLIDLGMVEERLGKGADAERRYAEAEKIVNEAGANQPAYYRELSMFYAERLGRSADALDYAKKDMAVRKDVRAYDVLAWALYRNKRFDEARAAIGEAMKLGTRDPDFFYHAGMIHDALGDREKAKTYLEEAAQISPRGRPELAKLPGATDGRSCKLRN